jgi:hypothetical protein
LPLWPVVVSSRCLRLASAPPWERLPEISKSRKSLDRLRHEQALLHPMALGRGYMDRTLRGRGSEGEGRRRGRHRCGGIRWCGAPAHMQSQIQRMGGMCMSSAVIGRFCEHSPVVHELVAKFADMPAKETGKEHGARVTAPRGHSIPEAPQTTAAGHVGMARLQRKQNRAPAVHGPQQNRAPAVHARFATSRPRTRGGEQRNPEHSRTPLGRREWAAQQGGTCPGCGRAARTAATNR